MKIGYKKLLIITARRPAYRAAVLAAGTLAGGVVDVPDEVAGLQVKEPQVPPRAAPPQSDQSGCAGEAPRLKEPSLADMAKSFGAALSEWRAAGYPVADEESARARGAACAACGHWDPAARLGLGKCRHQECGCTKLKWFLATSRCPEGRWPKNK